MLVRLPGFAARLGHDPFRGTSGRIRRGGGREDQDAGCIACHGRDGVSKLPEAPNLSGQVEAYIASSLKAYHSGERKNEIMNTVAQTLSEADMADLAAYYSSIKVAVTSPPKP